MMPDQLANESEYGPIDVYVVEFEGERVDPAVLDSLLGLSASGTVRVVDIIVAVRAHDGTVRVTELRDDAVTAMSVFGVELEIEGLLSDEDVEDAVAVVAPGYGVAIAAIELRWAAGLAARLNAAGGRVVRTERIPGPEVNALVAAALAAEGSEV